MSTGGHKREWHAWSVWKNEILVAGYLSVFTKAGTRSRHRVFIDCFAGTDRNLEQGTGREIRNSPRIALDVSPPFTHLVLFETPDNAAQLEDSLRAEYPGRDVHVIAGDCNARIGEGLQWLRDQGEPKAGPHLGQALAYLDPNAMELDWATVATLADWGMTSEFGGYKRRNRVEQLILFPTGPMRRTLPGPDKTEAGEAQKSEVDRLFGNRDWRDIYAAQRDGRIAGEDAWLHYVELYRLGLVGVGYQYTSAIEVRNTSNVVLYHLIFATGHRVGAKIMNAIQDKARQVLPSMIAAEKRRRSSAHGDRLFEETDADLDQIAAHPEQWARLFDAPPQPFDPQRFQTPFRREQLGFEL